MKRIGITQRVEVISRRGERRDCLDQRWAALLEAAGYVPIPLPSSVEDPQRYAAALDLAGVILSGGNDLAQVDPARSVPERDRLEAALLEFCGRERLPVLGVCRGMQFIVASHGGSVAPVSGHVGSPHLVTVDRDVFPVGHAVRSVNSFHGYGVRSIGCPAPLRPAARAEDGSIEAVVHPSLPQVGIMWHPERESPYERDDLDLLGFVFTELGGA